MDQETSRTEFDDRVCPACEYSLRGLDSLRCPECGTEWYEKPTTPSLTGETIIAVASLVVAFVLGPSYIEMQPRFRPTMFQLLSTWLAHLPLVIALACGVGFGISGVWRGPVFSRIIAALAIGIGCFVIVVFMYHRVITQTR